MLLGRYSALNEIMVVMVPAPAIIGNAIGTIDPEFEPSVSLNKVIPRTISIPRKNKIKEPATAKERISTPNNPKTLSPKNKNKIIIAPATKVAFPDSIVIPLFLISSTIGIEPMISITPKRISVTDNTCVKSNSMCSRFFVFLKSSAKVLLKYKGNNQLCYFIPNSDKVTTILSSPFHLSL